jgi:hypothetical protein
MREQVLAAAAAAGRDPDAVTCALNLNVRLGAEHRDGGAFEGPAAKITDGLRHYAGLGFTTFNLIVAGEDPAGQTGRLATEVLPALRSG